MTDRTSARPGGLSLALAALLFSAVFTYLAVAFDYPAVLDGRAEDVLPALLATGPVGRAVWAVYALLPLLLIPAGVGAFSALRHGAPGAARLGQTFATVAAVAMPLGLARWPTVHWVLAEAYVRAPPEDRATLAAVFDGLNRFLGNAVGEFGGELALYGFLASTAWAAGRDRRFPRWVRPAGLLVAAVGWTAMFRNVTPLVGPVNEVANGLLPLWLLVFGVVLASRPAAAAAEPPAACTGLPVA